MIYELNEIWNDRIRIKEAENVNTINRVVRIRKMKEGQFFCVNARTYIIDTIDEEHKKINLTPYDKNDKDTSISIDFDECVYDSVTDGSSIQKAWKLAGVCAMNIKY